MAGNAKTLNLLMAGCLVWGASGAAFAQQALPSVDELVNKLSPRAAPDSARGTAPAQASKKKFTRGLVMNEDAEEKPTGGGTQPNGTPMVAALPDAQVKYMTDKIPMKRCGELDEAAEMISFIVSPACSFTTGFTFDLTGGRAVY